MKKTIGILDEVAYSYELMQKLNQELGSDFFAYSFSEINSMTQQMQKEAFDVLIVGEAFYEQSLKDLSVSYVIVLTEQANAVFKDDGVHTVYKYQAFHKALQEMKKIWSIGVAKEMHEDGETYFIGVYSPVRRCGKTTFALALAKEIAACQTVLYLNLEPFCSDIFSTEPPPEWNLSDVLYFMKEKKTTDLFSQAFFEFQGVKAIYPMNSPLDLQEIEEEEWSDFFCALGQQSLDCVIVDFDESTRCFWKILERCNFIYMPVLEDETSRQKVEVFDNFIEKAAGKGAREKLKQLSLPVLQHTNLELINKMAHTLSGEINGKSN